MAENKNIFQRLFSTFGFASGSRIPIRSNVYGFNGGGHSGGYNKIGSSTARIFGTDRKSALLGNYTASSSISGWLDRVEELKGYEYIDLVKLSVSFFQDYVVNFLNTSATQVVTILDEEGNENTQKTERINDVLVKDLKIFDFIRDHINEVIYYGAYYSMLRTKRDEKGHLRFYAYGLYDPVSVIIKRTFDRETEELVESYIVKGDDGVAYVVPDDECFYLGSPNMRLKNDLKDKDPGPINPFEKSDKKLRFGKNENRSHVLQTEYYTAGEPIFYTNILKLKELVVKELLISLLTLRDLCTPSILALMFDKGVPLENAEELCTKVQRMLNSYNDLSSFLSAQFDATSLIENILSQNIRVIPDFNATLQNKGLINTDKLSDKLLELMQSLDQTKQNILGALGIPGSILDGTIGTKWSILQSSERANSRVFSIMTGLKESTTALIQTIHKIMYEETIDPSLIKLHLLEKSTVEYNNAANTLESVSGMASGITNLITTAIQSLDIAMPLVDPEAYVTYINNMIKDIDPNAADLINEETIKQYIEFTQAKYRAQLEQLGINNEE